MHIAWIDVDDAPEITDEFFEQADEYEGDRLIRRGRPKAKAHKQHVGICLSPEVLEHFRSTGAGLADAYQRGA